MKIIRTSLLLFLFTIIAVIALWKDVFWLSIVCILFLLGLGIWLLYCLFLSEERIQTTRQKMEGELRCAQQQTEEYKRNCLEEQTQFYSNFSHSVRMPLSIIKGYAELLQTGDIDRENEIQYLEKIVEKSQAIVDFFPKLQDNLEIQELSAEKKDAVDLLKVVQECVQEIKNGMCFDTLRIQVLSQEKTVYIRSNAARINEVIYNLLENAAKYMQRPGIVTFRIWKDQKTVHLHVRDDGMGIKQEEANRIFEKNYQGSNQKGGRGYGLYWVQKIVLAYGGKIWAESELGKGMSIHLVFPEFEENQNTQPATS